MEQLAISLNKFADLLEYKLGTSGMGTKYLTRTGVPGNYTYIYPNDKANKLSRSKLRVLTRWMRKHSAFVNKINVAYRGNKMQLKTLAWGYQLATISDRQGTQFRLGINLKKHKIYGYKSKIKGPSASAHLNSLRKRGILRHR